MKTSQTFVVFFCVPSFDGSRTATTKQLQSYAPHTNKSTTKIYSHMNRIRGQVDERGRIF